MALHHAGGSVTSSPSESRSASSAFGNDNRLESAALLDDGNGVRDQGDRGEEGAMSHDPMPTPAQLEQLELILGGHVFFQTLRSAVSLDVFTLLARSPGVSLARLA